MSNVIFAGNGDGATNVTEHLQTVVDSVPPGGTLEIESPVTCYLISDSIKILQPITILGNGARIQQQVDTAPGFEVTSGYVQINGLCLSGPGNINSRGESTALRFRGASAVSPLCHIQVVNCTASGWGQYGIYGRWIEDFDFTNNRICGVYQGGIALLSAKNGSINLNRIKDVTGPGQVYGVILTRVPNEAGDLDANPLCQNIDVIANEVDGVRTWEGLDTHGGAYIRFKGNKVKNCLVGINVGPCPKLGAGDTYGPKYCEVTDNRFESGKEDGSCQCAIKVSGVSGPNANGVIPLLDAALGCRISGNTCINYGQSENDLGSAIMVHSTLLVQIVDNTIVCPGKAAVLFYYNNFAFSCSGNTIMSPWSTARQAQGINFNSQGAYGFLGGNTMLKGSKTATRVMEVGVNVNPAAPKAIRYGKDWIDSACPLPVYDPGHFITQSAGETAE